MQAESIRGVINDEECMTWVNDSASSGEEL